MLLFILIVVLEMLVCSFRGTKKNVIRLVCNICSILIAGGLTWLFFILYKQSFAGLTGIDLTFEGNLSKKTADTVNTIITAFAKGVALSVIFSLLYLLIKIVSLLITKLMVKDESEKGFKPLGLIFGFVIGIICAGFVMMPYTGLQQVFPDRKTAVKVADYVSDNVDHTAGNSVRFFSGPTAQKTSKYLGVGIITNKIFNTMTTAKTDAGKECLAEFLPPYFKALDDVKVITDEEELLSGRIIAGADALDVFSETKLFTDKEKVSIIEHAIKNNIDELDELPEYKSVSKIAQDIKYAGRIVEVLEGATGEDDLLSGLDPEDIELKDSDIEKIADNLYSMNAAPFYVNYLLDLILDNESVRVTESNLESTRPYFVNLLKTAMKLKDLVLDGDLDYSTLEAELRNLKDSPLITEEDYRNIISTIRENYTGDDIPPEIFDYLLD